MNRRLHGNTDTEQDVLYQRLPEQDPDQSEQALGGGQESGSSQALS